MTEKYIEKTLKDYLDGLYQWSIDIHGLNKGIDYNSDCKDYVSFKVPFPFLLLEDYFKNKALRSICVERIVWKLFILSENLKNKKESFPFFCLYCIITEPNLFESEVGVFFSKDAWDNFLFRNVNVKNYREETKEIFGDLSEKYNVFVPKYFSYSYFSHVIDDLDEDIFFNGNFHCLWEEF